MVRYGDNQRVQQALWANFVTEGWTGPESQHLLKKQGQLLELRLDETNQYVLTWIDEFISYLDRRIESARQEEELEDRS